MSEIKQGTFYRIKYKNGKTDILESFVKLEPGYIYNGGNGKYFKVIGVINFKYTLEDIDNLRVLMEGYDEGTLQDNLRKRLAKAFKSQIPSIRISSEEKDLLSYVYYENEYLSEGDKATLRKVLGIK